MADTRDAAIAQVETGLGALFGRVRSLIRQSAASMHPELQPGSYKALAQLVRCGPRQAGELAGGLAVDKSVLSRQLRQLEQLGLASATTDPTDGRARVFAATPDAIERFREISTRNQQVLRTALGEYPAAELDAFAKIVGRLSALDAASASGAAGAERAPGELDAATRVAASARPDPTDHERQYTREHEPRTE